MSKVDSGLQHFIIKEREWDCLKEVETLLKVC